MPPGKLRFRVQILSAIWTATGCPSLSLRTYLIPYKSVGLSLLVLPCWLVSVSVEDSKNPVRATSCGFESHLRHKFASRCSSTDNVYSYVRPSPEPESNEAAGYSRESTEHCGYRL